MWQTADAIHTAACLLNSSVCPKPEDKLIHAIYLRLGLNFQWEQMVCNTLFKCAVTCWRECLEHHQRTPKAYKLGVRLIAFLSMTILPLRLFPEYWAELKQCCWIHKLVQMAFVIKFRKLQIFPPFTHAFLRNLVENCQFLMYTTPEAGTECCMWFNALHNLKDLNTQCYFICKHF